MSHALASASEGVRPFKDRRCVLVVSNASETITVIDNSLSTQGFDILVVSEGKRALSLLNSNNIDFVLIDIDSVDMPGDELVYSIRVRVEKNFIPVIVISSVDNEELLSNCLSAGSDDFIFKPFTATVLKARLSSLEQVRELKQLYKSSLNEQLVAKQILAYALSERNVQFEEIKLLSKSKGIFSGDLFLTARHRDGGLHVLLADFTGHGLSAAIGALPVADIFSVMTEKGFELEDILENINNKLHTLLPVSMFMACIVLKINSESKQVRVWNGGMPDIYVRNSNNGDIKQKLISRHIPLGISDSTQSRFVPETIESDIDDQFIIYTDGLTDAVNSNGDMFGYQRLEQCLEKNRSVKAIFPRIIESFNKYCDGVNPDDDVTLACVPCTNKLTEVHDGDVVNKIKTTPVDNNEWCWYLELSGSSLRNVNPVPIAMSEASKISGSSVSEEKLSCILSALYDNALEHGLQFVADEKSQSSDKNDSYRTDTKVPCEVADSYLRIGLKKVVHQGDPALLVSVEDSGKGFDHADLLAQLNSQSGSEFSGNDGIPLVYEISDSLNYHGRGNLVEAIISENISVGD